MQHKKAHAVGSCGKHFGTSAEETISRSVQFTICYYSTLFQSSLRIAASQKSGCTPSLTAPKTAVTKLKGIQIQNEAHMPSLDTVGAALRYRCYRLALVELAEKRHCSSLPQNSTRARADALQQSSREKDESFFTRSTAEKYP